MKHEDDLNFFIDVEPVTDFEKEKRRAPRYIVSNEEKQEQSRNAKFSQKCWNCGGGHNLQGCKAPRNHLEIARNRKAFMTAKERKGDTRSAKRYHEQNEQRYGKFKPGILTKKLRRALGLNEYQLPKHIYKMRKLGYPPGWLKEAQIYHSSIQMYDGTGEIVPDPDMEEGEIENEYVKYNADLIVNYPGFNIPPNPDVIDEASVHDAPLMTVEQSKEMMVYDMIKKGQMYEIPERNVKPVSSPIPKDQKTLTEDIDAEETELVLLPHDEKCTFVPPLPLEELPPPPPDVDIETVQQTEEEEGEISVTVSTPKLKDSCKLIFGTPTATPPADLGKVKSVYLGTPVMKNGSPYSRVPSYEKFSDGMTEVLNFENLPGSTGTYDKMLKVLKKVRNSIGKKS